MLLKNLTCPQLLVKDVVKVISRIQTRSVFRTSVNIWDGKLSKTNKYYYQALHLKCWQGSGYTSANMFNWKKKKKKKNSSTDLSTWWKLAKLRLKKWRFQRRWPVETEKEVSYFSSNTFNNQTSYMKNGPFSFV